MTIVHLVQVYQWFFSWLPVWFQVAILGFIGLIGFILVWKIISFIKNGIPFL